MNTELISAISNDKDEKSGSDYNTNGDTQNLPRPKKGRLQMDATVADQCIAYPIDSKILNESRKQCKNMIDGLRA